MGTIDFIMKKDNSEYLADGIAAFEGKHFAIAQQILGALAEDGNAEAQFRMAIMQQNGLGMVANIAKAFDNMLGSAKQGHALAMHSLGFMYYQGECTDQDYSQAKYWFEKAAAKDMAGSMMSLGMMYAAGQGVDKDETQAKYWNDLASKTDLR